MLTPTLSDVDIAIACTKINCDSSIFLIVLRNDTVSSICILTHSDIYLFNFCIKDGCIINENRDLIMLQMQFQLEVATDHQLMACMQA